MTPPNSLRPPERGGGGCELDAPGESMSYSTGLEHPNDGPEEASDVVRDVDEHSEDVEFVLDLPCGMLR